MSEDVAVEGTPGDLRIIPIDEIHVSQSQLRKVNTASDAFKQMVTSMLLPAGLVNPISVRIGENMETGENEYILVDGLHRLTACKEAGYTSIKANVLSVDEKQALYTQIVGNVNRVETKPYEIGVQLTRAIGLGDVNVAQLADSSGMTVDQVRRYLKLDKLDPVVGAMVDNHDLDLVSAIAISGMPFEEQASWAQRCKETGNAVKFVSDLKAHKAAQRKAVNEGKDPTQVKFEADPRLRKATEIRSVAEEPVSEDCTLAQIVRGATNALEAGRKVFDWLLQLDPETVAKREADFNAMAARQAERKAANQAGAKERALKKKLEEVETLKREIAAREAASGTQAETEAEVTA